MSRITEKISQRSLEFIAIMMMLLVMCVFIAGLDSNNTATIAADDTAADMNVNDDAPADSEIVYQ